MPAIAENSNFVKRNQTGFLKCLNEQQLINRILLNQVKFICIEYVYLLNLYCHENLERQVRNADH